MISGKGNHFRISPRKTRCPAGGKTQAGWRVKGEIPPIIKCLKTFPKKTIPVSLSYYACAPEVPNPIVNGMNQKGKKFWRSTFGNHPEMGKRSKSKSEDIPELKGSLRCWTAVNPTIVVAPRAKNRSENSIMDGKSTSLYWSPRRLTNFHIDSSVSYLNKQSKCHHKIFITASSFLPQKKNYWEFLPI